MKKTTLVKTMLLLCALVVGSSSAWAVDYTLGWGSASGSEGTFTNFTANSGTVTDLLSFTTAKNSAGSNPAYNSTNKQLRLYCDKDNGNGGSITITPAAGVTISDVVITSATNPSVSYKVGTGDATSVASSGSGPYTYTISSISSTATSVLKIQNVNKGDNVQFQISTIKITYTKADVTKYAATFSVNGATSSTNYAEGEEIVFPADPSDIGEKKFMGWATAAIVGTTDDAPTFYTSATMGTSDVTYYAVFASQADIAGTATLTITPSTVNFPTSYGTANTFTEYTLDRKKFKIQQAYINNGKLQWRSASDSNGAGTIYNTDAMKNIHSIVLTYNGDSNKNFTVKIGDAVNPTSGTAITPSVSATDENVYTYDCSTYNKNYFVLTNGDKAGYLASIAIVYDGFVTSYSAYCTTVSVPTNVSVTIASSGYSTIASGYGLDFANATSGLEAYVVSDVSASAVTLAAIEEAPAGTGVILKGTAGETYTIPVKADATFDGTNKLKAAVYATGVNANAVYIMKGGKFCKVLNESIVPAGKAYLVADDIPAAARELNFVFGNDETTGLKTISNSQLIGNSQFYDLQGRMVANPTKGLYIVNGKKVVIK